MGRFILHIILGVVLNALMTSCVKVNLLKEPRVIKPYHTVNASITCSVTDMYVYGYYNGRYQNTKVNSDVVKIRILRKPGDVKPTVPWTVMAIVSEDNGVHCDIDGIQADGQINKDYVDGSFLKVTWPYATADTLGSFVCDVLTITDLTPRLIISNYIDIAYDLKGEDFARILHQYKKSTLQVTYDLQHRITEIESKLHALIDSGCRNWPAGKYSLLSPETGCPADGVNTWGEGYVRHHTESRHRNEDEVSSSNHLKNPVLTREKDNAQNFVTQHFCSKTSDGVDGPLWPAGCYCINRKGGSCPTGFTSGRIVYDEENTDHVGNNTAILPDGSYAGNDTTTIQYCCRADRSPEQEVFLPTSQPFFLYRNGDKCQQVYGMNVTSEYLLLDTENENNMDQKMGLSDVFEINNVRLELCYYEAKQSSHELTDHS